MALNGDNRPPVVAFQIHHGFPKVNGRYLQALDLTGVIGKSIL